LTRLVGDDKLLQWLLIVRMGEAGYDRTYSSTTTIR